MKEDSLRMIFLAAVVGSIGTSIGAYGGPIAHSIYQGLFPGPYAYLEGHYKGHWSWVDKGKPMETHDDLFITAIGAEVVNGTGTDSCYGDYELLNGSIDQNRIITAHYRSAGNSVQPSSEGLISLAIVKIAPNVVLEGSWSGVNRASGAVFQAGKVTLTRSPDSAVATRQDCSDETNETAKAESPSNSVLDR